ncbi:MAG TPA: hypothetical protein DCX89_05255 [Saprospirales bacterium]|nr:hypothetical protein [Saprospirales bacterium]HAY71278.1 hypothetical protein [Saprospirales bacterium]HRQ30667.1 hypothetical protein [Saprospiraceae bacterium]
MKRILFFGLVALFISSCGTQLKPFTQKMYEEYGWSERDLQSVQFYVSRDIVLEKKAMDNITSIKDGKIKVIEDKVIEKLVIKRGTPGSLLFMPKENRLAVSFDNDNNKYLIFGASQKNQGKFMLFAKDWDRNRGVMTYDGQTYYTTSASAMAYLMVDIREAAKVKFSNEVAPGRKVIK